MKKKPFTSKEGRCRMFPIDPEIDAVLDLGIPDVTEIPDAFSQLFEDGALANALGGDRIGHAHVERLEAEIAQLNKQVRKSAAPAPSNWNAEIAVDDAHRLEKRYVAGIHSGKR